MGLFNKLFSSSTEAVEKKVLPWKSLTTLAQLDEIKEKSFKKPQIIFKYSTRCGINKMVMNQFEKGYEFSEADFDLYYLDLLTYREVSNEISELFQIIHESPQLLIIKNGKAIVHKSHGAINDLDLNKFV